MRIRFEPENQRCVFEKGEIKITLFPCDHTDIKVAWKRMGVVIPSNAWRDVVTDGVTVRALDRSELTPEDVRKIDQDEAFLIASKLESIEGIDLDGTDLSELSERDKTDLVTLLMKAIPEFGTWCAQYVRGGEKKSGRMAID